MRYFFSLFTFLLLVKIAAAQVSAKATVDSTNMLLGDQMRLHLDVSHEQGVQLLPINPSVPKDSTIEFLAQSRWDTLQTGGTLRLRKDFIFMVWDSGYLLVPPIPVVYLQGGRQDTFFTNDIPLRVKMPQTDTTLADIKPIIGEPANWQDYLLYIIGVGVLILAIVLVLLLRKKKAQQSLPPPPTIVLPPHIVALQKLEDLKKQTLWQQGRVKEYHTELTYILREYLESRFGIQALEQTTDEILWQLHKSDFDRALSEKLTNLLQTADLVKFAKAQPPADFHDRAMSYVEDFIVETKPVFVPVQEELLAASGEAGMPAASSTEVPGQRGFELAGFWPRFFARLIDVWVMPLLIFTIAFGLGMLLQLNDPPQFVTVLLYVFFIGLVWAYFAVMEHWKGGTLGKIWMKIEVADLEGRRISLGRATGRFFSKIILSEGTFMLGYLLYFFDKKRRQTLHDKIAGTIVIKRRKQTYSELDSQPLDSF